MNLNKKRNIPPNNEKKGWLPSLKKTFKKKRKKENLNLRKKSKYYIPSLPNNESETKVFKPENRDLIKEKILNKTIGNLPKKKNKLKFGTKSFKDLKKGSVTERIPKSFALTKNKILSKINFIITLFIAISTAGFLLYLSFFDTYFLITKWNITFSQNSYISRENTEEIIRKIKSSKYFGTAPYNQFWFVNENSLTKAGKEDYPEIVSIKIIDKKWPNQATIEITTEPILITLGINETEYWRIGKNGRILGEDESDSRENLVIVQSPVKITSKKEKDFGDFTFQNKEMQKERFWFIIKLWQWLDKIDVRHIKTVIPSLSDYDSDVIVYTEKNTKLIFDVNSLSEDKQKMRLESIIGENQNGQKITEIGIDEQLGKISYIDFRTPKRVYICYKNKPCNQ